MLWGPRGLIPDPTPHLFLSHRPPTTPRGQSRLRGLPAAPRAHRTGLPGDRHPQEAGPPQRGEAGGGENRGDPSRNPPLVRRSLDAAGMGVTSARVEESDRRGAHVFPALKGFLFPTIPKGFFFLPCSEREMQKHVGSSEETSAQMGFGGGTGVSMWCNRPALRPLPV